MTVTSRLHRQKGKERQRKTGENGPKIRVRWRGSSTCAPGSGPRIAFAKNEEDGESAGFGAKTKTFFFVVEFSDDFEHERSTSGVTTRRGCP